jgi:hypothetical protein
MRRVLLATTLAGLLVTFAPASALAAGQSVIRDCTDNGRIDSSHSQSDYNGALKSLPSDVDEYTDCRSIIKSAQRRDAASGTTGSTSGTSATSGTSGDFGGDIGGSFGPAPDFGVSPSGTPIAPPTAAEGGAITAATGAAGTSVPIAGDPIVPGASGLGKNAGDAGVPGALLLVLLAAGAAALAGGIGARRRHDDAPAGPTGGPGGPGDPGPSTPRRNPFSPLQGVIDRVFPRRA